MNESPITCAATPKRRPRVPTLMRFAIGVYVVSQLGIAALAEIETKLKTADENYGRLRHLEQRIERHAELLTDVASVIPIKERVEQRRAKRDTAADPTNDPRYEQWRRRAELGL